MPDKTLTDAHARKRIATELDTNFIVEAGAGSGKTTVLIDRIVQTLKAGKCEIGQIAAVTFTRKAAAELRQKLQIAMEAEQKRSPSVAVHQALTDFDRCFAGTIHSFCSRLLRERPVEAGLDPAFEEVEGVEEKLMNSEAWTQYLAELPQRDPKLVVDLDEAGVKPADLEAAYVNVIAFPEVEFPVEQTSVPDTKKPEAAIEKILSQVGKLMPTTEPEGGWDGAQQRMRLIARLTHVLDLSTLRGVMEILQLFDHGFSSKKFTQKKWGGKQIALQALEALEKFSAEQVQPAIKAWRQYRYQYVMRLVKGAAEYCHEARKRESRVTFQDLLMDTSSMLRDYPDVRSYFQARFARLFVDEFQDTDPIQAEILFYLAGKELNQTDWRKLTPRPGSLFVVGDPKQSIYRFRRADIDTYNAVKELIKKSGGDELALTSNFRSDSSITARLNSVFKEIFLGKGNEHQARFEPLEATRSLGKTYASGIAKIVLRDVPDKKKIAVAQADADCIARYIRAGLDGELRIARPPQERGRSENPTPRDFMILLYRRRDMVEYARALERYGIPYEISGGNGFAESRELHALLDLVLCLNDPADPVRFFKTLRGELFGISDELFYRYKVAGGKFSIFAEQKEHSDKDLDSILLPAVAKLKLYWQWSIQVPAAVTLEMICEDLGLLALTASGELADSATGNVLKALDLVKTSTQVTSFARLVDYFQTLLEEEEVEESSVTAARSDAVRLMNLHKAKGLESSVVFLANPTPYRHHDPSRRIERGETDVRGYIAVAKRKGEFQQEAIAEPSGWEKHKEKESRYEQAEKERLQYVAATRARQLLVISVHEPKPNECVWAPVLDRIKDVPELVIPSPKPSTQKETPVDLRDLKKVKGIYDANRQVVLRESYGTQSITALVHKDGDTPAWVDSGHGMGWGRVVHKVLELSVSAPSANLDLLIRNVVEEQGLPAGKSSEVRDLVLEILHSALWKRLLASTDRQVEVPFSVKTTAAALGEDGGDKPVALSGTVDLIFKESDGWVLVDYKTDTISGDVKPFVEYYKRQLDLYAKFWSEATREHVKEKVLFFTSIQKEFSV